MDKKTITLLLEQNLDTIKTFVQLMFNDLKEEVNQVKQENGHLKQSLQFSQAEVAELKETVIKQSEELTQLREETARNCSLDERVRILDDTMRKNNLCIEGVPESQNENYEQTQKKLQDIVTEKLGLELKIEGANRVGSGDGSIKPRPIIARFINYSERQRCIRASPKLKGSNIYISEDVCKRTLEIRKTKLEELKEKRRQGYIAYFSGCRLVVKRRNSNDQTVPEEARNISIAAAVDQRTTPVTQRISSGGNTQRRGLRPANKQKQ